MWVSKKTFEAKISDLLNETSKLRAENRGLEYQIKYLEKQLNEKVHRLEDFLKIRLIHEQPKTYYTRQDNG